MFMKKGFVILAVAIMTSVAVFAQSNDFYGVVYVGGTLPIGDYGKVVMQDGKVSRWGLQDNSPYGGVGLGANAGFFGGKRISGIEELSAFVSMDFFFNPLNKTMRNYKELLAVENTNTYDLYEHEFPVYFNIPLLFGFRYDFYTSKRNLSFFAEASMGVNFLMITDKSQSWNMYKHTSEAYNEIERYKSKFSFALSVGGGAVLLEKIQVGLHYHYLGATRIISDSEIEYHTDAGVLEEKKTANYRGFISPHLLSLRVGYMF